MLRSDLASSASTRFRSMLAVQVAPGAIESVWHRTSDGAAAAHSALGTAAIPFGGISSTEMSLAGVLPELVTATLRVAREPPLLKATAAGTTARRVALVSASNEADPLTWLKL